MRIRNVSYNINTENELYSNSNEKAFAFEMFVLRSLEEYLNDNNKTLTRELGYRNYFDAYAPSGIDDTNIPTYIEIKYTSGNISSYFRSVERTCKEYASNIVDGQLLFIIGISLSLVSKESMISMACAKAKAKIIIWDLEDLKTKMPKYYDKYIIYLDQPKKALVEDAITSSNKPENESKNTTLFSRLKESFLKEDVVLFLGAGVSMDADIPLWDDLIKKLFIEMINNKLNDKQKKLNKDEIFKLSQLVFADKKETPLTQMRYIRSAFEPSDYNRLVQNNLYINKPKANTELLKVITKICTPRRNHIGVKGIVTYNFDDLVEEALLKKDIEFNSIHCDNDLSFPDKLNIYHVHGFIPRDEKDLTDGFNEIIFSEEDYHKVYRDAYCWSNIIQLNYLRENTCLFVGSSLTDPNIRRLLDAATRNGEAPRHYAIMKKPIFTPSETGIISEEMIQQYRSIDDNIKEQYFSSLGLNIIWVANYSDIPNLINDLLQ